MFADVSSQTTTSQVGLVARRTGNNIYFFPVGQQVFLQMSFRLEGLAAMLATVWLPVAVSVHVLSQCRPAGKSALTNSALKRFFACMSEDVSTKMIGIGSFVLAQIALKRLLSCVGSDM